MSPRRTWVWIVIGALGLGLICLIVAAGAGVYFVTHHIRTQTASDADSIRAFDSVRVAFHGARPLYEMDSADEPHLTRPLGDMPASEWRSSALNLLAWDPDKNRLVRMSLPLWVLRFGQRHSVVVGDEGRGFDLERLNLDPDELARIGPALVFDFRNHEGVRVLVWTE